MVSKNDRMLKKWTISFLEKISRVKKYPNSITSTRLKRCLTTFDIVFFGIGHMVGGGLYLSTGNVIPNTTGPAICLSYLLAGIAAFLSALCYAELEGRIPTAGSAYSFSYVAIGELWAFLVGWNMLLENSIGAAALAKAWSSGFDVLIEKKISEFTLARVGPIPEMYDIFGSENGPDFLAMMMVVVVSLMVCLGSRRSANFNTFFAILNLCVMTFVVTYGLVLKNDTFWTDINHCPLINCTSQLNITVTTAFMPCGPSSVVKGAAQVYFAYIGFNCIASAGEETKDPQRALPRGTILSMVIVIVAYILMSATLTLVVPYCNISIDSPFPKAFLTRTSNYYIYTFISIGALSAMTTVLFGNLWVNPRTLYSMASDGLLFKFFKKIYSKTQVPVGGVFVFGLLAAVLASCFKLEALMETTSLGTLMCYSIVSCCVILLRYRQDSAGGKKSRARSDSPDVAVPGMLKHRYRLLGKILEGILPSKRIPFIMLLLLPCLAGISVVIIYGTWTPPMWWWCSLVLTILTIFSLICILAIFVHNASTAKLHFKVPMVPVLPVISLFLNILLMVNLAPINWGRFAVWLMLGIIIYLAYGLNHSKLNPPSTKEQSPAVMSPIPSITMLNNPTYYNTTNVNTKKKNYITMVDKNIFLSAD